MFKRISFLRLLALVPIAILLSGCISPKDKIKKARLLETSSAPTSVLMNQVNALAAVKSMNAKMYLKFEDNSYAELGIAEKYKTADSTIVVQRPGKISLKVEVPIIGTDVAKMTSDGKKFCVAILEDGAGGKYRGFVCGTNNTDYSMLAKDVSNIGNGNSKEVQKNVNAFSNLRPQHFTDAMLMRPIDTQKYSYAQSTILQEEFDIKAKKKAPTRWVLRGYYLLDEYVKNDDGTLSISRRFWFDRVGGVNLARQQVFDAKGEIESDIVYGKSGQLTSTGQYKLPLEVELTRPKEKYKIRLIHKAPKAVKIGREYPARAFVLKNDRNLREVDLDKKLREAKNGNGSPVLTDN